MKFKFNSVLVAPFQIYNSHIWLVVAILDNGNRAFSSLQEVPLDSDGLLCFFLSKSDLFNKSVLNICMLDTMEVHYSRNKIKYYESSKVKIGDLEFDTHIQSI